MGTEKHASLPAVWRRIDQIHCISLTDRRDRQAGVQDQFARAGLDGQVAFFLARRHPVDCEQGIFESHQACLKSALEAGARHVLVFEDDVCFGRIDPARLAAGIDFFLRQKTCQILFLGCLVSRSRATAHPAVREIGYRCLAHAYLVKASLALRIVDRPWQGIPFDNLLAQCTATHFALYPSIAFQSDSPSDNVRHRTLDTLRRLLGGLRFIQMANERYHRFRFAVILAHLLVVGVLIRWMLTR